MWAFLFFLFVCAVIFAVIWSYHTANLQKRAWAAFAARYQMNFIPAQGLQPPALNGQIKDRSVNIYAQPVISPEGRQSLYSVVEVFLNNVPDELFVVSSTGFADFQNDIDLPQPFAIDNVDWPRDVMARTLEDEDPVAWFQSDKEYIRTLRQFMEMPFDTALVCDRNQAFLVVRTPDPLTDPNKINRIIGKLFDYAAVYDKRKPNTEKASAKPEPEEIPQPEEKITKPKPDKETAPDLFESKDTPEL